MLDLRSTFRSPRPETPPRVAAAGEAVLAARDIHKSFREGRGDEVAVLRGVSLDLAPGEVVALEGPSGSGKTTLLSILGCILTPSAGELWIEGRRIDPARPSRLPVVRRRSIGFVFQQFNLFPALTARENVEYALNVKGERGRFAAEEADRVLEAVGLGDRRHFLPRDLSGGQKQRVAIARALAGRPAILLADEPTANLDSHVGGQVLALFRDLAKREGSALLVVTHDPTVRAVADRAIRIRDGRILDPRGDPLGDPGGDPSGAGAPARTDAARSQTPIHTTARRPPRRRLPTRPAETPR